MNIEALVGATLAVVLPVTKNFKALKGRNISAWGNAPGISSIFHQPYIWKILSEPPNFQNLKFSNI
jgi:hypothetical protein